MSRFAPRARVLKRGDSWLTIYPSGSKRTFYVWRNALNAANEAVAKERLYDLRKEQSYWVSSREYGSTR